MKSRKDDMMNIFNELNERNKDIVILVARSVKVAQEEIELSNEGSRKVELEVTKCQN